MRSHTSVLLSVLFSFCLTCGTVGAQSAANGGSPLVAPEGQPQIAFIILKDYVDVRMDKDMRTLRIQGWTTTALGGLVFAGGITSVGFWTSTDPATDYLLEDGLALGLLGCLDLGLGLSELIGPTALDRHNEYQLVLSETDPILREAMAAATLKGWSDEARKKRILTGYLDFALAPMIMGMSALFETSRGRPWYSGYTSHIEVPLLSVAVLATGGVSFLRTSPLEDLYQKYLTARNAAYSLPSQTH